MAQDGEHPGPVRILVVEDEEKVAAFLAEGLREQALAVDIARDGEEGVYRALNTPYDVVLLDVMLPKRDGFSVLRALRKAGCPTRVMMLTARDAVGDRVHGLNEGADDYLSKPFDFDELLARVGALLRRPITPVAEELRCADLVLNRRTRQATRAARAVELSAKQFAVLEYLMLRKNEIVGRSELAEHAWDEDLDPLSNVIDVTVHHLRARVDKGHAVRLLHTVRGMGYTLREGTGA